MRITESIPLSLSLAVVLGWGTLVPLTGAAASKTKTAAAAAPAASSPTAKSSKPEPVVIPQSIFEVPKSVKDGHDPFFPDSARPYGTSNTSTNIPTVPKAVNLILKGLAGPAGAQFATIALAGPADSASSINLAVGEEGEIATPTRVIKIRCIEIRNDLVIVETGGERRELHLRAGF